MKLTYAPPIELLCNASWYPTAQSRITPALAGSGSTPPKTPDHSASRKLHAVSPLPTRWTAPSIGYRCIVECIVGRFEPNSRCVSIASSLIWPKKSPRQYHWSPGGYSPSNRLWSAGYGIGAAKWKIGGPTACAAPSASSWSAGSVMHQTTPATFRRWMSLPTPGGEAHSGGWPLRHHLCMGCLLWDGEG